MLSHPPSHFRKPQFMALHPSYAILFAQKHEFLAELIKLGHLTVIQSCLKSCLNVKLIMVQVIKAVNVTENRVDSS